jgi:hypothetical protein
MNGGVAPPDAPAQWPLVGVGGLRSSAPADEKLLELQVPLQLAQGSHIEAVVYPPPHYTPVHVDLHTRPPAATVPESAMITLPPSGGQISEILPSPVLPHAERAGVCSRPVHRC